MFVGDKPDLNDIWPFREERVFVIGKDGFPWSYDGKKWVVEKTNNANPLMGMWAASEKDIYSL